LTLQLPSVGGSAVASPPRHAGWEAMLALGFERVGGRSVLARREHRGPLVVQKPLYPEGPDVCQCVILHPPAGIVGGDRLVLTVSVGRGARAQLTTPGATRWYRSANLPATQQLHANVADGALLEWLPQGTIVHDGACAASTTRIDVAAGAGFIGTEIVSLGRRAAGERFRCGAWRQRFEIVRDGAPIWSERAVLKGDGELLASAVGLNGAPVFGTFVAVMPGSSDTMMPALRDLSAVQGQGSVTRLTDVVVARYVGDSMEAAGAYFMDAWSIVRPLLTGLVAVRPRIFNT
jgi:urease accessory protein